jgi:hypothetical protein
MANETHCLRLRREVLTAVEIPLSDDPQMSLGGTARPLVFFGHNHQGL